MLSYAPWVSAFEGAHPLIPVETITSKLDRLETDFVGGTAVQLDRATSLLLKPGRDIQSLSWGFGGDLQRSLSALWSTGYSFGARHGWAEMRAAVPEAVKRQARSQTFELDNQVLSAIAALLTGEPGLIIPLNVEQAIANRVLKIAGDYSKDLLNQIKTHLTVSALGQDVDLKAEIQKTLKVGRVRAETIARNELTYAYNTARVQVFRQSSLVSHVRFISILDGRTSPICRSRNGMVIPMANVGAIEANRPPLHHRCRSLLSPVMPLVNPDHEAWVDDPKRAWDGRELEPLADGWRN